MAVVSLLGVQILNNPAPFEENYHFEITFECLEHLEKGTMIYLVLKKQANQSKISNGKLPMSALLPRKPTPPFALNQT